jgi:hypothetical protein
MPFGAADAAGLAGIALVRAARRAGGVVLGGVGQDGEFLDGFHRESLPESGRNPCDGWSAS